MTKLAAGREVMGHEQLYLSSLLNSWGRKKHKLVLFPGHGSNAMATGTLTPSKDHHRSTTESAEWERSALITPFHTEFLGNICPAEAGGFVSWLRIQHRREGTVQEHPRELKHLSLKWLHQSMHMQKCCLLEMHFLALRSTTTFNFNNFNFRGHPFT